MDILKRIVVAACVLGAASAANAGVYFEDNFDGEDLSSDWTLENPAPDDYLVESGTLTLLVPDGTSADFGAAPNTLVLKNPVPKGDWTMTARLLFTPQTLGEVFKLGVAKDPETLLSSTFSLYTPNYATTNVYLTVAKLAKGQTTKFYKSYYELSDRDLTARASAFPDNIKAVELQLEKKKHAYIARMRLEPTAPGTDGAPDGKWREVQKLTSLRAAGNTFFMTFGSSSTDYLPHDGEALIAVDWVRIETP